MSRKRHNGLQVGRELPTEASAGAPLSLLCGTVLFALARLTGMEQAMLPALTGAVVCFLAATGRGRGSGLPALVVLAALLLRSRICDGYCQWYNGAGSIYTAGTGLVLPKLASSEETRNILVFGCWLSAVMGLCFPYLFRRGGGTGFVVLLCAGVAVALGEMVGLLPLLLAAAMLCAGGRWKRSLLPLGVLAAFVLLAMVPGAADWAAARSEAVRSSVHELRNETKYTTLPEGKLEPLEESEATVLIVTMEKPEVLYLRGFTGAELTDERWEPLDTRVLEQEQELLYWLNSREFDLRAQFEAAAAVLETGRNTVTVQNVGACSAYRYIPFTVCADGRLSPEDLTETAPGERIDSFTTIYGGEALVPELLTALEGENSRYLSAEAAYREFVRAHYLEVPGEMAERMEPYWTVAEGMAPGDAVKAVLDACYPDGVAHDPFGATAAVLTLRHFGIPARYAEGYILPRTTQTTLELTGSHAACWAEVYHDGIGWIPMELTPGTEGDPEQQEEQTLPPDTPEETLPPETEPAEEPEPSGGTQVRIARVLLNGAVMVLAGLILAVAMLLLRRKHILNKRQAILDQADIREAVIWSFADGIRLLEHMGIRRGNGSPAGLCPVLTERFGPEFAERFDAASGVNGKALFSSHPMTEQERQMVHSFRASALERLRQSAGPLRRFWMQYILCLY